MSNKQLSDYGVVGERIQWSSAAGILTGIIRDVKRNQNTANPIVQADYYTVDTKRTNRKGEVVTIGAYLNSNMMQQLNVINLTQLDH